MLGMSESDRHKKSAEPSLEPLLQAHIGKQLKEMFGAMTREPVPDRFKLLLDRLEASETPQDAAETADDKAGAR
jgi:hypothetical protein